MHPVFAAGLSIIAIALLATFFIKELTLRTLVFTDMEIKAMDPDDAAGKRKDALLRYGLVVAYLSMLVESRRWSSPELLRATSELVDRKGDASVRERALRANEEVLEPLARSLLLHYLLQGREPYLTAGRRS